MIETLLSIVATDGQIPVQRQRETVGRGMIKTRNLSAASVALAFLASRAAFAGELRSIGDLTGTWTLSAAYEIHADGSRTANFSEHPQGLLMIDAQGRYSLQIFRPEGRKFALNDKARGQPEEYRAAVLGASTHFGHVSLDPAHHKISFQIDAASYANWEGTQQTRDYSSDGDLLTYAVPASASADGTIAYSVWRHDVK